MKPLNIRFCGFGGQGIVLTAVIFGTAAVTKRDFYVVQTQSYSSEARGGECQSELIISDKPINSPIMEKKDILVAMFQNVLDVYLPTLRSKGTLIIDPKLVTKIPDTDARVIELPATEIAIKLGNRLASNMVVLGFLQQSMGLITKEDLVEVVTDTVPERFLELNLKAVDAGIELAKEQNITLEV